MNKPPSHLNQYAVTLRLTGIQHEYNPEPSERILNEIAARAHWECLGFVRESDEILVEIVAWGLTAESTAQQAAEELFEITCAVLDHPEGISVHIKTIEFHNPTNQQQIS